MEREKQIIAILARLQNLQQWQLEKFEMAVTEAEQAALNPSKCRSCGTPIIWAKTDSGKNCPFDYNSGESHFKTCPQASKWSKKP